MISRPWLKFYPRDWRGDQALRFCSMAARGLWMEMLCIMHEASPYGHLVVGAKPLEVDVLARMSGAGTLEVQAWLVELQTAGVYSRTRNGVIFSRRMIADHKRAEKGRKDKLDALREAAENKPENPDPSRGAARPPRTQRAENRRKVEGPLHSPSTLPDRASADERTDGSSASRPDPPHLELVHDEAAIEAEREERLRLVNEALAGIGSKRRVQ